MKIKKQRVFRTITETDQIVFDRKCNKFLQDVYDAEYHFNNVAGAFSVTIIGMQSVTICESISEEYEERGEEHKCCECKYFEYSTDKRIKYVRCPHSSFRVSASMNACDFFYTMLEAGEEIFKKAGAENENQ